MFGLFFFPPPESKSSLFLKNSYSCLQNFLNCKGKGKEIYFRKRIILYRVAYFYHFIVNTQFSLLPLPFLLRSSPSPLLTPWKQCFHFSKCSLLSLSGSLSLQPHVIVPVSLPRHPYIISPSTKGSSRRGNSGSLELSL